jgi:hypothetical protein
VSALQQDLKERELGLTQKWPRGRWRALVGMRAQQPAEDGAKQEGGEAEDGNRHVKRDESAESIECRGED